MKLKKIVMSLFFPPRCPVCDEILSPEETPAKIHAGCQDKLYLVQGAVCMHCGRPFRKNLRIYSQNQTNTNASPHMIEEDWNMDNGTKEYCRECHRRGYVKTYATFSSSDQFLGNREISSPIISGKALYVYRGDIKLAMYRFKYSNKREYAYFFAQQAVERYPELFFSVAKSCVTNSFEWKKCADAIIPIPMYPKKQRRRGYNQAESIAYALSELTHIPVDTKLIQRIRDTTPQKELDDTERKNNLKNAFQIAKSVVKYNKVIVVDDIYSTGSTMETVAKELKYIGIHQIYALCICIGEEM